MPKHIYAVEIDTPFEASVASAEVVKTLMARGAEDLFGAGSRVASVSVKSDRATGAERHFNRILGAVTGFALSVNIDPERAVDVFRRLAESGGLPGNLAVPLAVVSAGVGLVAVNWASDFAADPLRKVAVEASEKVGHAFQNARQSIVTYLEERRIETRHQKAVLCGTKMFSDAMDAALSAAGAKALRLGDKDSQVFVGDARELMPALNRLVSTQKWAGADITVIAPVGSKPKVLRKLPDGTAVALWVDDKGRPRGAVGFNAVGKPIWSYSHATRKLQRDTPFLTRVESLSKVAVAMETTVRQHADRLTTLRRGVVEKVNKLTHTATVKGGFLFVRDRNGRLDNPDGPALLTPEGKAGWALAGRRMARKDYRIAVAKADAAHTRAATRQSPEVATVLARMTRTMAQPPIPTPDIAPVPDVPELTVAHVKC